MLLSGNLLLPQLLYDGFFASAVPLLAWLYLHWPSTHGDFSFFNLLLMVRPLLLGFTCLLSAMAYYLLVFQFWCSNTLSETWLLGTLEANALVICLCS